LNVLCCERPPKAMLASKPKLAVSGETSVLIVVCGADVTMGGLAGCSRSDLVIMRSAGILCWPLDPLRFFFGPICPDGEAGRERFLGVIEVVDLWPCATALLKLFQ
jgi:hypothetical protein